MIAELVGYFTGDIDFITALEYGMLLVIGICVVAILQTPLVLSNRFMGMKLRISFSGLIYKKVFKFDMNGKENEANGRIMNLITNDVNKFEFMFMLLGFMFIGPFQALFYVFCFARLVHVDFLFGLLTMVFAVIIQYIFSKLIDRFKYFNFDYYLKIMI